MDNTVGGRDDPVVLPVSGRWVIPRDDFFWDGRDDSVGGRDDMLVGGRDDPVGRDDPSGEQFIALTTSIPFDVMKRLVFVVMVGFPQGLFSFEPR